MYWFQNSFLVQLSKQISYWRDKILKWISDERGIRGKCIVNAKIVTFPYLSPWWEIALRTFVIIATIILWNATELKIMIKKLYCFSSENL